jgi:hypothetical protein
MPYIKPERRTEINNFVGNNAGDLFDIGYYELKTPGELNFALTTIISGYLEAKASPVNYQLLNEIMGVIGCVKAEFYRRLVVPYEIRKEQENGDVF